MATGTVSSGVASELSGINLRYDDHCIRELAFDLGVDARGLKQKLASLFSLQGAHAEQQY